MDLSEEDRQRLRAEESFRAAVRRETEPAAPDVANSERTSLLSDVKQGADVLRCLAITVVLIALVVVTWTDILPRVRESLAQGELEQFELAGVFSIRLREQLGQPVRLTDTGGIAVSQVAGDSTVIEKGSVELLGEVRERLEQEGMATIENMKLVEGDTYFTEVLRSYIGTLGIKFVIFESDGGLDGWIDSSLFAAQLEPERAYSYDDLRRGGILGIQTTRVSADAKVNEVLRQMSELHLDHIAVVDQDDRFGFIASRGDLLTQMLAAVLVQNGDPEEGP